MKIVEIGIEKIKPYDNNPRRNERGVQPVANSIRQFGFKVPIVVDSSNVIVAGHTRYQAAKLLGMQKVPCVVADDLTEDQVKAFRIADNKAAEQSEWNFFKLAEEMSDIVGEFDMGEFGFGDAELESLSGLASDLFGDGDDEDDDEPSSGVYTPTYNPQTSSRTVTDQDVYKETARQQGEFRQMIAPAQKRECVCPHCGKAFYVD